MTFRTSLLAAAALLAATAANATVQTITQHGRIFFQLPPDNPYNPDGLIALLDFAVGDAITQTITYDDAELGPLQREPNAGPDKLLGNPRITGVALGNGNPANSVTFTVGSHTVTLADFVCAADSVQCEQDLGLDFHLGPTAIFYEGRFIGLDSLFGIGGSPSDRPNIGEFTKYVLDPGDPFLAATIGQPNRSNYVFLQDAGLTNLVFLGEFDDPGVAAVPEPASWALLIGGFGFIGGALRQRRAAFA